MQVVLMQRILKVVPAAIDLLGPAFLGQVAGISSPSCSWSQSRIARKRGDDHVIDLGAALGWAGSRP